MTRRTAKVMAAAKKNSESAYNLLKAELDAFDTLVQVVPVDLDAVSQQFNDVEGQMETYLARHGVYLEHLLAGNQTDEFDQEEATELAIKKRRNAAGYKVNKLINAAAAAATAATATATTTAPPPPAYRINLPQRKMPVFSSDLRQWRSFWASFQEVDKDPSIPPIEKYNYLLEHMEKGTEAHKVVAKIAPSATSYETARDELVERFGNTNSLIKVYVRDLMALVTSKNSKKMENFIDVVTSIQAQILNLEELGVTKYKFGLLLYPIIESCLPKEVLDRYLEIPGAKEDLEDILDFLKKEVRRKEESARAQFGYEGESKREDTQKKKKASEKGSPPTTISFTDVVDKPRCGFCNNAHTTADCRKAANMTLEDRRENLKKSGVKVCFKCLKTGHQARKCSSNIKCDACGGNHHKLLCSGQTRAPDIRNSQVNTMPLGGYSSLQQQYPPPFSYQPPGQWVAIAQQRQQPAYQQAQPPSQSYQQQPDYPSGQQQFYQTQMQPVCLAAPQPPPAPQSRTDLANFVQKPDVLLQTLLVYLHTPSGPLTVRLSYDSMSQGTYVTAHRASQAVASQIGVERVVHQTFGAKLSKQVEHPVCEITLSGIHPKYSQPITLQASIVENIARDVIGTPPGPWIEECRQLHIPLTDVNKPADIDVLIGNDFAPYLKVGMASILLQSGLVACETKLGWFLGGRVPGSEKSKIPNSNGLMCINMLTMENEMANFWSLEALGIRDPYEAKSRLELEQAALQHFQPTVSRDDTGRYVVHLPWVDGHPALPENKNVSTRKLERITKILVRDGNYADYNAVFMDWEREGIIERVHDTNKPQANTHYLSHRPVLKPGSTTPVRPVFNGSAKTKGNVSLNDCLEKGPNGLELIPGILCRFRMKKLGVIADIKKAFLQILVTPAHRNCLRFLWWEEREGQKAIVGFQHCRVVFGINSSPFLLNAVVNDILKTNENLYPDTVKLLTKSFYVDNLVASVDSLQEVVKLNHESTAMFGGAQMDLRGWVYGPSSDGKVVSVLGLKWNTANDTLMYDLDGIAEKMKQPVTKRNLLSLANSLFDPLGWMSPFTIIIKVIFKKVCQMKTKVDWDDKLPADTVKVVEAWKRQVQLLANVRVPRYFAPAPDRKQMSLHVFCDASMEAFACCVYLRVVGAAVNVSLVAAKARVTPPQVISIPRAELLACLIGARLHRQVSEDLDFQDLPVTFWSDSTTALCWILNTETVWQVWVNNRVNQIRELTSTSDWKHVPGELNYADFPSRGISVEKMLQLRWLEGSTWLRQHESHFPRSNPHVDHDAVAKEKKKAVVSLVNIDPGQDIMSTLLRLGDYEKIVRAVFFWQQFSIWLRDPTRMKTCKDINADTMIDAELILFSHLEKFIRKEKLPKGMQLKRLEDGLLHVETKLVASDYETSFSYPIVLPGDHPVVRLLVIKKHSMMSHAGVQTLATELRKTLWIVGGRRLVRSVVHNCPICRVHMATRCTMVGAPLPASRVNMTRCFDVVGVDLAGPLILKSGEKAWIVLFTCALYRAVHLEIVAAISTEAFLVAFRKFIARCGRPSRVYSDNGTNFVGSEKILRQIDWKKVLEFATVQRISWKFNPPTAAWWGGFWERLVGLVKQLLRRVLGKRSVEREELEVLVMEVAAVVNERPLTIVTEDTEDLQPLSPSLFMRDLPVASFPEADVIASDLRRNLKHVQRLKEELRTRFQREYLAQLVCLGKSQRNVTLKPGDVVLVEMDNKKRIEWPMGVVQETFPGRDGHHRTVKVKTSRGELMRPIQRIFPLEMKDEKPSIPAIQEKQQRPEDGGEKVVVTRGGRVVKKPDYFKS